MKNNYYLSALRRIIKTKKLDAIVVYVNSYDDRYMKALADTYCVLQNYLLITSKSVYISEARYLVPHLKSRTRTAILGAEGENQTIEEIIPKIKPNSRVGFVGSCKYSDLIRLGANEYIDINDEAEKIITYKSDDYILKLYGYAMKLAKLMDSMNVTKFKKQIDTARELTKLIIDAGCSLSFPVCITSGNDLKKSTAMLAQDKVIQPKDIVCIDMGLKKDIFTTDRTRMYFPNSPDAELLYKHIKKIHFYIISHLINSRRTFRDVINEYKLRLSVHPQIKKVEEEDFGHGIGFSLHEQPILEQANRKIGTNIVFTIEPSFDTVFGKMRIEDIIAITSTGKVINLTK